MAFVVAMIFVAYLMSVHILKFEIGLWEFATDAGSGVVYLYIIVFDLFMLVLRQVNLMLGEGNLTNLCFWICNLLPSLLKNLATLPIAT